MYENLGALNCVINNVMVGKIVAHNTVMCVEKLLKMVMIKGMDRGPIIINYNFVPYLQIERKVMVGNKISFFCFIYFSKSCRKC